MTTENDKVHGDAAARGDPTSEEIHIAGLIVHARPAAVQQVRTSLALLPKSRVHAAASDGRMVVTLETDSAKRTLDFMDAIRALDGVINVALVYQHAEDASAMNQEVQ